MRRTVAAMALLGSLVLTACNSDYDPDMCDFYKSLGAGYTSSQGYVPSDIEESQHQYCDR